MKRTKPRAMPPLLQDQGEVKHRESHHRRPKRQEKDVAVELGGRTRPGSGAFSGLKGDVSRTGGIPMLIECKRAMGKQSIRLEARHLIKISDEALGASAYPALDLQFDKEVMDRLARAAGRPPASTDWIAVPRKVFAAMLERLGEESL